MIPFYLSTDSAQQNHVLKAITPQQQGIYTLFSEPQGHSLADYAVLMCYPLGQEYVRSHRALRTLSAHLAQKGVPSLRFDYRGTGDASGHLFELDAAMDDIRVAARCCLLYTSPSPRD